MKKVLNIITILLGLSFYSSVTYAADNWITYQCPKLPKANYFNGKALNLDHHNWKVFVMGNSATFAVDEWRITIEADPIDPDNEDDQDNSLYLIRCDSYEVIGDPSAFISLSLQLDNSVRDCQYVYNKDHIWGGHEQLYKDRVSCQKRTSD